MQRNGSRAAFVAPGTVHDDTACAAGQRTHADRGDGQRISERNIKHGGCVNRSRLQQPAFAVASLSSVEIEGAALEKPLLHISNVASTDETTGRAGIWGRFQRRFAWARRR